MKKTIYLINSDANERLLCSEAIKRIDPTISIKNADCASDLTQLIDNEGINHPSVFILAISPVTKITHLHSFLTLTIQSNVVPIIISTYEGSGIEGQILNCGAMRFYSKPFSNQLLHGFLQELIADHLT